MVWQEGYEKSAVVGHDTFGETQGQFRKRIQAHAAATLYTTAEDYARFVSAMMNDVGLKKETIIQMLTPQIKVDKDVSWGLGFGIERPAGGEAFWQWGDYGIFRNYVVGYKKQKIGAGDDSQRPKSSQGFPGTNQDGRSGKTQRADQEISRRNLRRVVKIFSRAASK